MSSHFGSIFPAIPNPILAKLEMSYNQIRKNFRERRFEPSELNGGKFCEAVYRLLEWKTSGTYTAFGLRISNFGKSLRKFEGLSAYPDSIRFHIPGILEVLYSIRNKRGVGHVGGDVDPNHMDAIFVVAASDWVMAELVRLFHAIDPAKAQEVVEQLVTKRLPIIWKIGDTKRILSPHMSYKDKSLVLLYDEYPKTVKEAELLEWVEHSNVSVFRRDILRPAHKDKLLEYDEGKRRITLSPTGVNYVEKNIELEV